MGFAALAMVLVLPALAADAATGESSAQGAHCGKRSMGDEIDALAKVEGSWDLSGEEFVAKADEMEGVLAAGLVHGEILVAAGRGASSEVEGMIRGADAEGLTVRVVESCVSVEELAQALENVNELKHGPLDTTGIGYSLYTDRIVVTTTLDAESVVATLRVPEQLVIAGSVEPGVSDGRLTRTSDAAPHKGGAVISNGSGDCSSGFTVRSGSTRYSTTAGHCGGGSWTSGSHTFATSTYTPFFPTYDISRLSGSTYTNQIYGSNNNFSSRIVNSRGNPAIGYTYCNFGAVSRYNCFTQTHSTQSHCGIAGCTVNLALSSTPGSEGLPGDSGGPIGRTSGSAYAKARGMVVAQTGPFYGGWYNFYYHIRSDIETFLGVTIATS